MDEAIKKKKRFNSKNKGNGFESKVAKILSDALNPLKFMRTPGSGARVGGKNFESFGKLFDDHSLKLFVGDIVPINEKEIDFKFKFSIECKFYKTPDGFTSLVAGTANIFKWMQEALDDASKTGKAPLLIFKWNNTPIFAAQLSHSSNLTPKLTLKQNNICIDIFYLDDLLSEKDFWIEPKFNIEKNTL